MICTLLTFFVLPGKSLRLSLSLSLSACAQAAVSVSFGSPSASFLRVKAAANNTTKNAQKLTI